MAFEAGRGELASFPCLAYPFLIKVSLFRRGFGLRTGKRPVSVLFDPNVKQGRVKTDYPNYNKSLFFIQIRRNSAGSDPFRRWELPFFRQRQGRGLSRFRTLTVALFPSIPTPIGSSKKQAKVGGGKRVFQSIALAVAMVPA